MTYRQRDVVMVTAPLPDGKSAEHPFLIITCGLANSKENFYTGVMMTGSAHRDIFSCPIDDSMFEGKLDKGNCHLRLYIFTSFRESSVIRLMTRMKRLPFTKVVEQITGFVLSIDNN